MRKSRLTVLAVLILEGVVGGGISWEGLKKEVPFCLYVREWEAGWRGGC